MPAWETYKAEAKSRGALAMELYVVHSTPNADMELVKATLPDHLAYQKQMEAAGTLFLAGPVSDLSGKEMQAQGMIIYRAESLEAARAVAEADPMHATGARSFEIRKWLVNEGSLSLSVALSGQSASLG
ncbi:YciI family protein [Pseudaestuariivita sp.]|uniref:YciI family protein n=1 Tax=Pseudaestuariivita sp. TaxID=2211669 RepID=UPI0040584917